MQALILPAVFRDFDGARADVLALRWPVVLLLGGVILAAQVCAVLAAQGHRMVLVDRRAELGATIRTTGIFVRKTLDDFDLPAAHLGPGIKQVVLYPPSLRRPVALTSNRVEYRLGDMGPLYRAMADGVHAHVGVAGYHHRFPGGLRRTLERFLDAAPGLDGAVVPDDAERRGGPIPVGGVLRRIACPDGLLVGDAAGAVSPLTAGGLDPCLRLWEHAADVLHRAISSGTASELATYDGAAIRAKFRGRLTLRRGLALVRTPALAELAFAGLYTPMGRMAARKVMFGDRSFPTELAATSLGPRPLRVGSSAWSSPT